MNIKKGVAVEGCGDAITGERIHKGQSVVFTGLRNRPSNWMRKGRYRVVKEETIVELAKAAGFRICGDGCDCKSDERVSESASVVEREDVGVGVGEASVGTVARRGRKAAK